MIALDVSSKEIKDEANPLLREKEDINKFPPSIRFIMVTEICERFSYYGLRAILALYLHQFFGFSEDTSTVIVHAFTVAAYTSTLLGGYISDAILGKYHTIFYVCLLYCCGSSIVSITAIPGVTGHPPHWWGMAIGLSLVALSTGGIKPVVSAFVGDQFSIAQAHLLSQVYHIFYFCINLGSVLSTITTPLVRTYVSYYAAFGLPAVLLVTATAVFWAGRNMYKNNKPTGSVLSISLGIIWLGITRRFKEGPDGRHWLDRIKDNYPSETVVDVKSALSVLLVFTPLPVFWALFDQHASRWIFQASKMNRHFGEVEVEPDQIPALNPLLVLMFVPLFDRLIYPSLLRAHAGLTPLKRIGIGMVLAVSSFIVAAFLQLAIDREGDGHVHIVWQLPQYILITSSEIMVSITGLEFAYTQAPNSMKSLIMAGWQLTVAVGNLVVVVVAQVGALQQWKEFLFFSGIMLIAAIVFIIIANFYKYVDNNNKVKEDAE